LKLLKKTFVNLTRAGGRERERSREGEKEGDLHFIVKGPRLLKSWRSRAGKDAKGYRKGRLATFTKAHRKNVASVPKRAQKRREGCASWEGPYARGIPLERSFFHPKGPLCKRERRHLCSQRYPFDCSFRRSRRPEGLLRKRSRTERRAPGSAKARRVEEVRGSLFDASRFLERRENSSLPRSPETRFGRGKRPAHEGGGGGWEGCVLSGGGINKQQLREGRGRRASTPGKKKGDRLRGIGPCPVARRGRNAKEKGRIEDNL